MANHKCRQIFEKLQVDISSGHYKPGKRLPSEADLVRRFGASRMTVFRAMRPLAIAAEMLEVLKLWRQTTQFSGDTVSFSQAEAKADTQVNEDWMFASPVQLGRLPWAADTVNDAYFKAARLAGIGRVSTHSMRHTYRSWLDAVGTGIAVQQKLMRHADIRTTMNVYGDVVTDEMVQAHSKVVGLALSGSQTDRKAS